VIVVKCDNEPLVPVTVTVNDPDSAVSVQDRVEVPDVVVLFRAMPARLRVQARPTVGEVELVRVTVPVNPCRPVTVTVDCALVPENTVTLVGFAVTVKSCTV
jgi:hypothetical protein